MLCRKPQAPAMSGRRMIGGFRSGRNEAVGHVLRVATTGCGKRTIVTTEWMGDSATTGGRREHQLQTCRELPGRTLCSINHPAVVQWLFGWVCSLLGDWRQPMIGFADGTQSDSDDNASTGCRDWVWDAATGPFRCLRSQAPDVSTEIPEARHAFRRLITSSRSQEDSGYRFAASRRGSLSSTSSGAVSG